MFNEVGDVDSKVYLVGSSCSYSTFSVVQHFSLSIYIYVLQSSNV